MLYPSDSGITQEADIGFAMKVLKLGGQVSREAWNEKIYLSLKDKTLYPWPKSDKDLLAEDYYRVTADEMGE